MEIRQRIAEYEHEVQKELISLAEPHVNASPLFELLEPGSHPSQSLLTRRIRGAPQDIGTVEFIAGGIEPRFRQFTEVLEAQEQNHGEISRLGELLRDDQNIILVTNHGDIKDIAYTLAAYYIKLKERKYEFHSSLVMSKIISYIGVNLGSRVDPAVDILKLICDDEFFSFPRTKSIEESKIAGTVVDTYNDRVRRSMGKQLKKGRNLFAIAASGTTDKQLKDDPDIMSMGPVKPGTAKLMMTPNSLVVPVAVWLSSDQVLFQPCGIPRRITSFEEADSVMLSIAAFLSDNVEDKKFIYTPDTLVRDIGKLALEE